MATVSYDTSADTLYVTYRDTTAASSVEEPAGVLRRFDEYGGLIGVTVLDFTDRLQKLNEFADKNGDQT